MAKTGKTTGNLKMRSGPGMEFEPPIAYLEPETALEILEETEHWLRVKAAGKEGWVGRSYVEIQETPVPAAKPTMAEGAAPKPSRSLRPEPTPLGMTRRDEMDEDDRAGGGKETQGKVGVSAKPKAPTGGHETAD